MKKLFLIMAVAFFGACSSKYDESREESTAPSEEYASQTQEYTSDSISVFDETSEPMTKKLNDLEASRVTTSQNNIEKKVFESTSDTLYLSNVRLSKKLIKTADLKFKVKNVEKATNSIEWLTIKLGGYVNRSNIRSNYISTRNIEISSDTIMEVIEYYVDNTMIIKVPNIYFDSVLTELGKLHIYLDHREVTTEDVSTTFLRNKLKAEKRTEYEKRIQNAVDKAPRKLDDITYAEKQASDLADMAIDKKIENYQLQDRIDFSTLSLSFYQANSVYKEYVENTRLTEYQPDFWQKAWKALKTGWKVILEIIVGLLYLWPLYILAIGIYYLIKYFRGRMKK